MTAWRTVRIKHQPAELLLTSRNCTGTAVGYQAELSNHCTSLNVQFIYCGRKATLSVGNTLPLGEMPEGTIVCNVEAVRGMGATSCSCSTVGSSSISCSRLERTNHVLQALA